MTEPMFVAYLENHDAYDLDVQAAANPAIEAIEAAVVALRRLDVATADISAMFDVILDNSADIAYDTLFTPDEAHDVTVTIPVADARGFHYDDSATDEPGHPDHA
jgi:hypothetical protein